MSFVKYNEFGGDSSSIEVAIKNGHKEIVELLLKHPKLKLDQKVIDNNFLFL